MGGVCYLPLYLRKNVWCIECGIKSSETMTSIQWIMLHHIKYDVVFQTIFTKICILIVNKLRTTLKMCILVNTNTHNLKKR